MNALRDGLVTVIEEGSILTEGGKGKSKWREGEEVWVDGEMKIRLTLCSAERGRAGIARGGQRQGQQPAWLARGHTRGETRPIGRPTHNNKRSRPSSALRRSVGVLEGERKGSWRARVLEVEGRKSRRHAQLKMLARLAGLARLLRPSPPGAQPWDPPPPSEEPRLGGPGPALNEAPFTVGALAPVRAPTGP